MVRSEVGRAGNAKLFAQASQSQQGLTRTHRVLLLNARLQEFTDDFGLRFGLLLGEHINELVEFSRQVYLFSDHVCHGV